MKRLALIAASMLIVVGCEEKKPAPVTAPAKPATPTAPAAPAMPKGATPAPAPSGGSAAAPAAPAIPGFSPETTKGLTDMAAGAKEKVVTAYQSTLDSAKTQLDGWMSKIGTAPADQKPGLQATLDKVKGQWTTVQQQVTDLKSNTTADWQKLSGDVKTAIDSLTKSITDAAAQFK